MTKTVLIPNEEDFSEMTEGADELRVQVSNLNPRSKAVEIAWQEVIAAQKLFDKAKEKYIRLVSQTRDV